MIEEKGHKKCFAFGLKQVLQDRKLIFNVTVMRGKCNPTSTVVWPMKITFVSKSYSLCELLFTELNCTFVGIRESALTSINVSVKNA